MNKIYDLIVVGAGPAGIMASISAAKDDKKVLIIEKMPQIALKLKATGEESVILQILYLKMIFVLNLVRVADS